MKTIYKPVPGYRQYCAGTNGSIWRYKWNLGEWKKLKGTANRDGCVFYGLSKNGKVWHTRGHIIVLTTFVGPCPDGLWARHLDGNPANNRLSNLKWDTPSNNAQDRITHGTQIQGETHHLATLTATQVAEVKRRLVDGERQRHLALEFGVDVGTICMIANDRTWKSVPWPDGKLPPRRNPRVAPNAGLTISQVRQIKNRLSEGEILRTIAADFGVSISAVSLIKTGKNWSWV